MKFKRIAFLALSALFSIGATFALNTKTKSNAVKEMNRLGIMDDISHVSSKNTFDMLQISEYSVITSHFSAEVLCNRLKNISEGS